jgi:uncharacterized protein involved in type VI secretion and phage assembly
MTDAASGQRADGEARRYFGVYPAIVTNVVDRRRLGRIQVRFPWLGAAGDRGVRAWATLASPYADGGQGLEVLPAVDSQVVVAFEGGSLRRPYVLGACWNGRRTMPVEPARPNDKRVFRSRSGSLLEFDDTEGRAKVTITTSGPGGGPGHRVVLDTSGAGEVTVSHSGGSTITLTASQVQIQANGSVDITAPTLNVHAGTATFDGIVNCTTLNASVAVTSPLYTIGAGNIW